MKRILLVAGVALLSIGVHAQVGVGTETPKASLDVKALNKDDVADGILIPRIDKDRAQTMPTPEKSTMVYIKDIGRGGDRTKDVKQAGFYYWTGREWALLNKNLENSDIYIQGSRTILLDTQGDLNIEGDSRLQEMNTVTFNAVKLGIGKTPDYNYDEADLQVAGAIQSDALKSSANTIVASNAKGELVHGGVSQADLVNMITEIKNIKSKAEQDNKHRLVKFSEIKSPSSRERITGTSGYWYWDQNLWSWRYVGLVKIIYQRDGNARFTHARQSTSSHTFYMSNGWIYDIYGKYKSADKKTGISNTALAEIMRENNRSAMCAWSILDKDNGLREIGMLSPYEGSDFPGYLWTNQIGVVPIDQLWYYDE